MKQDEKAPIVAALACYTIWGLLPIYWKALISVNSLEILCHRVVWSVIFLVLIIGYQKKTKEIFTLFKNRKSLSVLFFTSCLIGSNWGTYIWAVNSGHVLESSLGYYINPLMTVFLGMIFLKERMTRNQTIAIVLASAGVLYLTISLGKPPWIALFLAVTFGFYGLVRKILKAPSLSGLAVETTLLAPLALGYIVAQELHGPETLAHASVPIWLLLVGAGPATAVPLVLFAYAANQLRLSTMGILQFLAPTGQFLCAVLLYHEPFSREYAVAFICIWTALVIYCVEIWRKERNLKKAALRAP